MAKFCDRSPCAPLMGALGRFIFGSDEGFVLYVPYEGATKGDDEQETIYIEYCPFCGTRLDEVPQIQIEKLTRPKRRKSAKPQTSV